MARDHLAETLVAAGHSSGMADPIGQYDVLLAGIGIATALWCLGLAYFVVKYSVKRQTASLDNLVVSLGTTLVAMGERMRQHKLVP